MQCMLLIIYCACVHIVHMFWCSPQKVVLNVYTYIHVSLNNWTITFNNYLIVKKNFTIMYRWKKWNLYHRAKQKWNTNKWIKEWWLKGYRVLISSSSHSRSRLRSRSRSWSKLGHCQVRLQLHLKSGTYTLYTIHYTLKLVFTPHSPPLTTTHHHL